MHRSQKIFRILALVNTALKDLAGRKQQGGLRHEGTFGMLSIQAPPFLFDYCMSIQHLREECRLQNQHGPSNLCPGNGSHNNDPKFRCVDHFETTGTVDDDRIAETSLQRIELSSDLYI